MKLRDEVRCAWEDGLEPFVVWRESLAGALAGLLVAMVYLAGVLVAPAGRWIGHLKKGART